MISMTFSFYCKNAKTIKQTVALVHIKSIEQSQCSYGFITHAIHPTPPKKKKENNFE